MNKEKNERKNKLVIFTGYECNNNCVFCINEGKRFFKPKTTEEILREIYLASLNKKADILELIGGEPTIRKDFLKLVAAAKKMGVKEVLIATNGRMFSDMKFAKQAVAAGLGAVIFSVHGSNAKIHDALTLSGGSFSALKKGIKNLKKIGFTKINGNTTVVKQNMADLENIAKFYGKEGIRNVEFIFVDPNYGGAYNNFEKYVPRISKAAPYIKKAIDIGLKNKFTEWKARYVPLCYFKDYFYHISEINERKLFFVRHSAPDFKNENVLSSRRRSGRRKTARCRGCSVYKVCEGIWAEYLKRYGDKELKPLKNV